MENWHQIITLVDEEGEEVNYFLENVVEVDGKKYAVVVAEEDYNENEDCEAVIYRIEKDENYEEYLVDIENDEEFLAVCEYLDALELEEKE